MKTVGSQRIVWGLCAFHILLATAVLVPGTAAGQPTQGLDLSSSCQDFLGVGASNGNQFGRAVAAGDLNSDGFHDLVVGAPVANKVYIFYGPRSSADTINLSVDSADVTITGKGGGPFAGDSLAIGDVNGDLQDDLLIGAPLASSHRPPYEPDCFNHGEVYILYGGNLASVINLAQSAPDVTVIGRDCSDRLAEGEGLASSDINNDGIDDILIGAWNANHPNPPVPWGGFRSGEAYAIYGSNNLPAVINLSQVTADIEVFGSNNDSLGWGIASGDVNDDGTMDFILGAWQGFGSPLQPFGAGPQAAGRVYVIYGSSNFPAQHKIDLHRGATDLTIMNDVQLEQMGVSVASGDVNGDGVDDVVAGAAPTSAVALLTGNVYVVYGSNNFPALHTVDFRLAPADIQIWGEANGDDFGFDVAVEDFDSDGIADILIGARHADVGGLVDAGIAYLIYGSDSFPPQHIIRDEDDAQAFIMLGGSAGDEVGWSVAIGDFLEQRTLLLGAGGFSGGGPGKVHGVIRAIDCDCGSQAVDEAQKFLDEECDPRARWCNHGEYMNCVNEALRRLIAEAQMNDSCKGTLTSTAAGSRVGIPPIKDCP